MNTQDRTRAIHLLEQLLALVRQDQDDGIDAENQLGIQVVDDDERQQRWQTFIALPFKEGGRNAIDWLVNRHERFSSLDLPEATQLVGGWGGVWASLLRTSEHHLGQRIARQVHTTWQGKQRITYWEVNRHLIPADAGGEGN